VHARAVPTTNELAQRVSPSTLRKVAVGCMVAGVALDVFTSQRAHYRTVMYTTQSQFWRRVDRPGGALVVAGLALLRMSSKRR
jgi:hypothetical protein